MRSCLLIGREYLRPGERGVLSYDACKWAGAVGLVEEPCFVLVRLVEYVLVLGYDSIIHLVGVSNDGVVLQVLPDSLIVQQDADAVFVEDFRVANAGQLQELGGFHGAG